MRDAKVSVARRPSPTTEKEDVHFESGVHPGFLRIAWDQFSWIEQRAELFSAVLQCLKDQFEHCRLSSFPTAGLVPTIADEPRLTPATELHFPVHLDRYER
jgi:hypothetical protein